jgi:hypothetical protein
MLSANNAVPLLLQIVLAFLRNIVAVWHLVDVRLIFSGRGGEPRQANSMPFRGAKANSSPSSLPRLVQQQEFTPQAYHFLPLRWPSPRGSYTDTINLQVVTRGRGGRSDTHPHIRSSGGARMEFTDLPGFSGPFRELAFGHHDLGHDSVAAGTFFSTMPFSQPEATSQKSVSKR